MFKKHMKPLRPGGQLVNNQGKGAVEEHLPSRSALSTITKGDPTQRTMQNYAKATPMASPDSEPPNIFGG